MAELMGATYHLEFTLSKVKEREPALDVIVDKLAEIVPQEAIGFVQV